MGNIINISDYLEAYATGTNTSDTAASVPTSDPYLGAGAIDPAASPQGDPNVANEPAPQMDSPPQEPSFDQDPQTPDMPEEKPHMDFEEWKKEYIKASIKNDFQDMKDLISQIQERDLSGYPYAFVRNNFDVLTLREASSNIDKACKEIKKLVKEDFDKNNPGVTIVNHITEVLQTQPFLSNIFVKMSGMTGDKSFYHRKYIAALLGAVQVSNGGATEDIVCYEKDFSVRISTRFNARFGDFYLGNWSLRKDDPERFLKGPELQRLQEGSPEEKQALKHRIIVESIAETFKERAFVLNVVNNDGTVFGIGLDLETCLKSGYTDGKLVVRTNEDDGSEAMIDDDGTIIGLVEMRIMLVKDAGELDDNGKPYKKEVEFMVRHQGRLSLTASLQNLKDAAASFPGIIVKEIPFAGNPSDLKVLRRCIPSAAECLLKSCM